MSHLNLSDSEDSDVEMANVEHQRQQLAIRQNRRRRLAHSPSHAEPDGAVASTSSAPSDCHRDKRRRLTCPPSTAETDGATAPTSSTPSASPTPSIPGSPPLGDAATNELNNAHHRRRRFLSRLRIRGVRAADELNGRDSFGVQGSKKQCKDKLLKTRELHGVQDRRNYTRMPSFRLRNSAPCFPFPNRLIPEYYFSHDSLPTRVGETIISKTDEGLGRSEALGDLPSVSPEPRLDESQSHPPSASSSLPPSAAHSSPGTIILSSSEDGSTADDLAALSSSNENDSDDSVIIISDSEDSD